MSKKYILMLYVCVIELIYQDLYSLMGCKVIVCPCSDLVV